MQLIHQQGLEFKLHVNKIILIEIWSEGSFKQKYISAKQRVSNIFPRHRC